MSVETTSELTCREMVAVVTDYLEGQIRDVERQAIEGHLGDCPGCGEYVRQMRLTIAALRGLGARETMFPTTRNELLGAFEALQRSA